MPALAARNSGSPPPVMTGDVQIRYSSRTPAAARASLSRPVPQIRTPPPSVCFSSLISLISVAPGMTTVGFHAVVSTGWEATTYLVIELMWSLNGLPPKLGQDCAIPS